MLRARSGSHCAFDADLLDTSPRTASRIQQQREKLPSPLLKTQRVSMACSRPTARTSASIGLDLQTAHTASAVTTITDVASVPVVAMEQAVAVQLSDPRCIVTLLDPSRTEALLRDYGILDDWGHV